MKVVPVLTGGENINKGNFRITKKKKEKRRYNRPFPSDRSRKQTKQ